jgi:EF-hand fold domain/SH2 domain
MVRMQFAVSIEYVGSSGSSKVESLESEPSHPFIVVTNESQWEFSEGMLLKKDAFPQPEVPWQHFANVLQVHYVRSTRQDLREAQRPLSLADLDYIHRLQFKARNSVHQKDFDHFWAWLGRLVHKIRHQKSFSQLWLAGLVYGFISKCGAEEILENTPAGTFLIRFSERAAGKQAVAYRKLDSDRGLETRHFLISPNEKRGV